MIKSPEEIKLLLEEFGLSEGVVKIYFELAYEMRDQFLQFTERLEALEQRRRKSKTP